MEGVLGVGVKKEKVERGSKEKFQSCFQNTETQESEFSFQRKIVRFYIQCSLEQGKQL